MKRAFSFFFLLLGFLTGCASVGPPLPPSLELPKPPNDLRALRKGDKVYLAWTVPVKTTDQLGIRVAGSTRICRSQEPAMTECGTPAGEAAALTAAGAVKDRSSSPKVMATYIDTIAKPAVVQPEDEITYAVEVLNDSHRGAGLSNQVHVPLMPAMPPFLNFDARVTADGVLVSWSCPPALSRDLSGINYKFRIYRRETNTLKDATVGEAALHDCLHPKFANETAEPDNYKPQFLDQSFEWEKTYSYHAAVVTMVSPPGKPALEIEGDDTPSVQVIAHDVFPPAVPAGLQAVFSGSGQESFVDLIWTPNTDADLAGYNIYRREEGGQAIQLNSELVKTPAYRDAAVQSGRKYFYAVAAVDLRNNESARSAEANESLP